MVSWTDQDKRRFRLLLERMEAQLGRATVMEHAGVCSAAVTQWWANGCLPRQRVDTFIELAAKCDLHLVAADLCPVGKHVSMWARRHGGHAALDAPRQAPAEAPHHV